MSDKYVAIIPARAGSQRLPGKNLKKLNGAHLISYTIHAALQVFDNVIVSTESEKIKQVASSYGSAVLERPNELALNHSTTGEVLCHAADALDLDDDDTVICLHPTSPLRTDHHIQKALDVYEQLGLPAMASVYEVPRKPHWNIVSDVHEQPELPGTVDVQVEVPVGMVPVKRLPFHGALVLNAAIYGIRVGRLRETRSHVLPPEETAFYVMDKLSSVDIDDQYDWFVADAILKKQFPTQKWRLSQ